MSKKKVLFIVGIVLTVAIVIGLVIFLVVTKTKDDNSQEFNDETLVGTWRVVAIEDDIEGSVTFVSNEFVTFDKTTFNYYVYGQKVRTSSYSISDEGFLTLPDLDVGYFLATKTSNYIKLWESETRCRAIVKYPYEDMSEISYSTSSITGRWDVTFHDKATNITSEYWNFADGTLTQYVNGETSPSVTTAYVWKSGNQLSAADIGKEMVLNFVEENVIILTETDTGKIYELKKAE